MRGQRAKYVSKKSIWLPKFSIKLQDWFLSDILCFRKKTAGRPDPEEMVGAGGSDPPPPDYGAIKDNMYNNRKLYFHKCHNSGLKEKKQVM